MTKIFRAVRGCVCIVILCLLLVPVNIAQLVSLVLLPINRRWFMRYNMEVKQLYCATVARGALICGNKLIVTGDAPRQENTLVFANHQSMIDIILIWIWCLPARTIGWFKWFAKDVLKYVPGMGWGMMFVNTIFLKRDWAKDADSIRATFAKLRRGNLPTWLVIFPEGTRLIPAKLAKSREYAARRGLPVLNHLLLPRGKGIHASLVGLDGHLASVYDVTIYYDGGVPGVFEFFTKGGFTARLHAVRHDIKTIPVRERDLNAWLLEAFVAKDQRMADGLRKS